MIFWFSGTGNTRRAALELARCTGDRAVSMADAVRDGAFTYSLGAGEPLGIVVPVYFWGIPAMAHTFLSQLKFADGQKPDYVYAVLVAGGSACNAVKHIQDYIEVDYWTELLMPDNYILMYDMKHPDDVRKRLREAEANIGKIYNAVRRRETMKRGSSPGLFSGVLTKQVYKSYEKKRVTAPFRVMEDRCTACGKCAELCPDRIIELRDGKPVWTAEKCDQCLACLHRCPTEAIQYGDKTVNRRRYHHPSLDD